MVPGTNEADDLWPDGQEELAVHARVLYAGEALLCGIVSCCPEFALHSFQAVQCAIHSLHLHIGLARQR